VIHLGDYLVIGDRPSGILFLLILIRTNYSQESLVDVMMDG